MRSQLNKTNSLKPLTIITCNIILAQVTDGLPASFYLPNFPQGLGEPVAYDFQTLTKGRVLPGVHPEPNNNNNKQLQKQQQQQQQQKPKQNKNNNKKLACMMGLEMIYIILL